MSDYLVPSQEPEPVSTVRAARPAFGIALSVLEWTDPADEGARASDEPRAPADEPELAWAVGQGRGGDAD